MVGPGVQEGNHYIVIFAFKILIAQKTYSAQRISFILSELSFLIPKGPHPLGLYFWSCQHKLRHRPGERHVRAHPPSLPSVCRFWRQLTPLQTRFCRPGMCWRTEPERGSARFRARYVALRVLAPGWQASLYSCYTIQPQQGASDWIIIHAYILGVFAAST